MPLAHVVDDALPAEFADELLRWIYQNRGCMQRDSGYDPGSHRCSYGLTEFDERAPDLWARLRPRLLELYQAALKPCAEPSFDLQSIQCFATLYHHGMGFCWHDDAQQDLDENLPAVPQGHELVPDRRLSYSLYLNAEPKMFSGGELELMDGTVVEPKHNRFVFFNPLQQHRSPNWDRRQSRRR